MKKNLEKMLDRFKLLEKEIVEILNEKPAYFDENDEKSLVKKSIKEYIKKINKAKKLFAEYEELAKQIEDLNSDEGDSAELSKVVLEFREPYLAYNMKESKEEEPLKEVEKKKNAKTKKKQKESVKEL